MAPTRHLYETFIRATPAEVWAAITEPEFTERYFYRTRFEADLRPGGGHRYLNPDGSAAAEGIVEVVEEGRRLVITWRALYDAALAAEAPGRVEWLLRPANDDATVTRVTVRHYDLGLSPLTSTDVALGWVGILDSLKSLLETGEALGDLRLDDDGGAGDDADHRRLAVAANGQTWELLGDGSGFDTDPVRAQELLERAYASAYHWRRAAAPEAAEQARAAWMLARCHTVAGHVGPALALARRCAELTAGADGTADFDRAYAHEALARAHALAGDLATAARERSAALAVEVVDDEDREIVEADLAAEPWFGLGGRFVESIDGGGLA